MCVCVLQVRSVLDFTAYHPPDWLKATSPLSSPYFPQVGDLVRAFDHPSRSKLSSFLPILLPPFVKKESSE